MRSKKVDSSLKAFEHFLNVSIKNSDLTYQLINYQHKQLAKIIVVQISSKSY